MDIVIDYFVFYLLEISDLLLKYFKRLAHIDMVCLSFLGHQCVYCFSVDIININDCGVPSLLMY